MTIDTAIASESAHARRDVLGRIAILLGGATVAGTAAQAAPEASTPGKLAVPLTYPGTGAMPWLKRAFHLFTGPDGQTRIETLPLALPQDTGAAQLLRRNAERVAMGGLSAGAGFDFHVANQPTILIPMLGSLMIVLLDGSEHEIVPGDIVYAEDCSGKGHISRGGPHGSFMAQIQLPKPLCPASGGSPLAHIWND